MKKSIKIMALCLCLALLGVLFTGCDYLDEMKANHAIISDDREAISFRGETYRKLPDSASIYYNPSYININVTYKDVPVLLSDSFNHHAEYDENKDLFRIVMREEQEFYKDDIFSVYSYDYSEAFADSTFYCNVKDYDKYVDIIENAELDYIGFEYETVDGDYNYYYTLEVADKEVSEEILGYVKNPEKMSNDVYTELTENYSYDCLMSSLYKCDSDGFIAEPLDSYDIIRDAEGNAYFINRTTETLAKLSDKTSEALKDVYFYGDYDYYIEADNEDSIGIIGSADGETDIFVTA